VISIGVKGPEPNQPFELYMENREKQEQMVQYVRAIFDAFPHPTFIVDEDVQIQDFNTAAEQFLGPEAVLALHRRGGEALQCIHAQTNGCGKAERCQYCVIRNSINQALTGKATFREFHQAELRPAEGRLSMDLLVTANLLPYGERLRVMLVLENVSEFSKPRRSRQSPRQRRLPT
jgi:PAS domain-containing protein